MFVPALWSVSIFQTFTNKTLGSGLATEPEVEPPFFHELDEAQQRLITDDLFWREYWQCYRRGEPMVMWGPRNRITITPFVELMRRAEIVRRIQSQPFFSGRKEV